MFVLDKGEKISIKISKRLWGWILRMASCVAEYVPPFCDGSLIWSSGATQWQQQAWCRKTILNVSLAVCDRISLNDSEIYSYPRFREEAQHICSLPFLLIKIMKSSQISAIWSRTRFTQVLSGVSLLEGSAKANISAHPQTVHLF